MIADTLRDQISADIGELAAVVKAETAHTLQLIPGERRRVTIVFLDLHDFAGISERLDHEMVARIVNGVMTVLRRVIESHGGQIDKFEGDLVMALFGAHTTREHDTARAVTCALKMLTALNDVNAVLRPAGIEMKARIGVNMGSVTVVPDASGHVTVVGDVVNTAARMESSAPLNTVQVTTAVHDACGDLFTWEDLGERQLKGKRELVRAWRPLGPGPAVRARWDRASRLARSPLVGRQPVLDLLELRLTQSQSPPAKWVGLSGEPGIGKSRLIHEFLMRRGAGCTWLRGHALPVAPPPWCAWSEALLGWSGATTQGEQASAALEQRIRAIPSGESTPRLLELLPYLRSLVAGPGVKEGTDEQSRRIRTVEALTTLIRALPRPLVLVLEDTDWLDPSSEEVLEQIISDPTQQVLVITSFRLDEDDGGRPSVNPRREEVRLQALGDQDCRALMFQMLGTIEPGTEALFLTAAEGNPFFLEELILDAIESGRMTEGDQGWKVSGGALSAPGTVEDVTRARLDRLSTDLVQILQRAAVVGAEFQKRAIARLSERAGAPLRDEQLVELEARGFLVKDASTDLWRFKHAITRTVVYETLLRHNRAVLHRFSAELIEEGPVPDALASIVALHWEKANDYLRASWWGMRALDYFRLHHHPEQGLQWAEKLELWFGEPGSNSGAEQLAQVLAAGEEFARWLMRRDLRARLIDKLQDVAQRFGLSTVEGRVLTARARLAHDAGRFEEAEATYQSAIQYFNGAAASRLMGGAWLSLGVLWSDLARFEEAITAYRAALGCLAGLPSEEALVLSNNASAYTHLGEAEQARQLLDQADRKLLESPNLRVESIANLLRGLLEIDQGNFDGAVECCERAVACASAAGLLYTISSTKVFLANAQALAGRLDAARVTADAWVRADRRWANPFQRAGFHALVASARLAAGDVLGARELVQSVSGAGASSALVEGAIQAVLGRCAHDLEGALASYERARALIDRTRIRPTNLYARDLGLLRDELMRAGVAPAALPLPARWPKGLTPPP